MCVISFIGDHYAERWQPYVTPPNTTTPFVFTQPQPISRDEFDLLKREVENVKELLIKAKRYDEDHDEADCSMDEKVDVLRKVAEMVGVDLSEVFGEVG